MFQPHEKDLVQQRLAKTLRGILSQKLVPTVDGKGRRCAIEILNVSPTVAQYLEEGRSGADLSGHQRRRLTVEDADHEHGVGRLLQSKA